MTTNAIDRPGLHFLEFKAMTMQPGEFYNLRPGLFIQAFHPGPPPSLWRIIKAKLFGTPLNQPDEVKTIRAELMAFMERWSVVFIVDDNLEDVLMRKLYTDGDLKPGLDPLLLPPGVPLQDCIQRGRRL